MLYVSRRVGLGKVGIVDTDDSVETIVGMIELSSMLSSTGLDIKGIPLRRTRLSFTDFRVMGAINVYQSDMYRTINQAKTKVLLHVDITLWRDMITGISWDNDEIDVPATIVLSNYARKCADLLFYNQKWSGVHKVTIVIDNFVDFTEDSFMSARNSQKVLQDGIGVRFDLRELTDDVKAFYVYKAVANCLAEYIDFPETIIDSDARMNDMMRRWGVMRF